LRPSPRFLFLIPLLLSLFVPWSPPALVSPREAVAQQPQPLPAPAPLPPPPAPQPRVAPVSPVVSLRGPGTIVPLGQRVFLDCAGTTWDWSLTKASHFCLYADLPVGATTVTQLASQSPSPINPPSLTFLYDEARNPLFLTFTPQLPGRYIVVVAANGHDAAGDLVQAVGSVVVYAGAEPVPPTPPGPTPPSPLPPPTPPGPTPPPPPPTPPGPAPVTGPLWGVLVLPEAMTPEQAALRTSPTLRAAFAAANATGRSYVETEAEVSGPTWKAAIAAAGGTPCVLWIGENGKLVKGSKLTNEAGIIADLKTLRGVK